MKPTTAAERPSDTAHVDTLDVKAVGYVGRQSDLGPWHLRTMIGLGLVTTYLDGTLYGGDANNSAFASPRALGVFSTAEGSISLGRDVNAEWSLHAGLLGTLLSQDFDMEMHGTLLRGGLEVMMLAGARRRL